jgi:hypothetical protein
MKKKIKEYISDSIKILKEAQLGLNESGNTKTIVLDEKYFNTKFLNEINISEYFPEFKALKDIKKPVLYWFELDGSNNNKCIREKYIEDYREPMKRDFKAPHYRNTSSYKKNYDFMSKTLYVGKVEIGFWGRLVTHLGYGQSIKTAGMQLFHWYKPELYGNIKLNYIVFEPNMKHLIIILEKQLANELKPLIGVY